MWELARRRREWAHAALIAAVAVCLAAGSAAAEGPGAKCRALIAGGRALVDVELSHLIDADLLKLVRLGLDARIELQVVLVRTRPFWFDEPVEREEAVARLRYLTAERSYVLDGRREISDPLSLTLDRIALRPAEPLDEGGRYKVEVKAMLQVVTPSSLGKVASWMAGKPDGEQRSELTARLLKVVAEDLARQARCSCDAEKIQPAAPQPASGKGP